MDKSFLLALADRIEGEAHVQTDTITALREAAHGFNMRMILHDCGTPCCLAGYAHDMLKKRVGYNNRETESNTVRYFPITEAMGISHEEGIALFEPKCEELERADVSEWGDITPMHASAVIRHFVNTGVVDWSVTK